MIGFRLLFCLLLGSIVCPAQLPADPIQYNNNKLKNIINSAIELGDVVTAIPYLEEYSKRKPKDIKMNLLLAHCYRDARNYKRAAECYKNLYESDKNHDPLLLCEHARMLVMTGEYAAAKELLQKFNKEYKGTDPQYRLSIVSEIAACDSAIQMRSRITKVTLTALDSTINQYHMEMSPAFLDDSTIVYAAFRSADKVYYHPDDTMHLPSRMLYTAKKKGDAWRYNGPLQGPFNLPNVHTVNAFYSPPSRRMFFARCIRNEAHKTHCKLCVSNFRQGKWSEPETLPAAINNPLYTSTQPVSSYDPVKKKEYIYFVSDRPGGKGGLDIWYTVFDEKKNTYTPPKNLGPLINTVKDEMTPFYAQEKGVLYFSSNGWPGLGGFDIFRVSGSAGKFTSRRNLALPFNSCADDLYFSTHQEGAEGFLVSNRAQSAHPENPTCCDDMYYYKFEELIKIALLGHVRLFRSDTAFSDFLPDATVSLYLLKEDQNEPVLVKTSLSDEDGDYFFMLEQGNDYRIVFSKEGCWNKQMDVSTHSIHHSQSIIREIRLQKIPLEPIRIKNIYYESEEWVLDSRSRNSIEESILPLLRENPDIIVEISSHTDDEGTDEYNLKLSQKRAESVVNFLVSKGISKERLLAKGYGESAPLAPNQMPNRQDNKDGKEKNRRTEFKIIGKIDREIIEVE